MELKLLSFPVREARLGDRTSYGAGVLTVGVRELTGLVAADLRVREVGFEVVRPGDRVVVTHIHDVVEPRVKASGPGGVFPGVLGSQVPVGQGVTHRLPGCAVIASAEIPWDGPPTLTSPGGLLFAAHDRAFLSPIRDAQSVVMVLRLAPGLSELEYHDTVQIAEYRVAQRLAAATLGQAPAETELLSLPATDRALPKVVLIHALGNEPEAPHPRVGIYGIHVRHCFPTWLHPNELIDGAVTPGTFAMGASIPTTFHWQNHAMSMALQRHHGVDLSYGGVILKPGGNSQEEKELMADRAARLARAAGASGAIVCWMGSGQRAVDPMVTLQACEGQGVRAALVTWEDAGPDGTEPPLVFTVPQADAMVSTGDSGVRIPAAIVAQAERIIGSARVPDTTSRFAAPFGARDFFGVTGRINMEF